MMNVFKAKRIIAHFVFPLFTLASFIIAVLLGFNFIYALALAMLMLILFGVLAQRMTAHPFVGALEAQGILVLSITSTGIIRTYLAKIKPTPEGKIKLTFANKEFTFNRDTLTYLETPKEIESKREDNKIVLTIDKELVQKAGFALDVGLPVLIYNEVTGTFLTKEDLQEKEKMYLEHIALDILQKTTELSHYMRDFARYIVEMMKPKKFPISTNTIMIIIIIVVIILLAIIFMPYLSGALGSAGHAAREALASTAKATVP